ncbi:MAG TPA: DUF4340 domain-containing protein [Candidatus Acidoferrales bacterium]|nr:DUF4340 domain-containing protein [Candidatus Acidoferrales bacterium]
MIRKSTLIVLLVAIIVGAAAYYFDWKRGQKEAASAPADSAKPAFTVQTDDISSLTISYPADPKSQPIHFEKQNGAWQITSPLQTGADDPSLQGILQQLASDRVAQTEPGTPDRLKVFGLDAPVVALDFQMKNGAKHSLRLGKKDFTGVSVYAIVDNAKDVALLPESLLVSADKPLQDLRDHSLLHFATENAKSFGLRNSSGELAAAKDHDVWNFTIPTAAPGDGDAINALLSAVANARTTAIVSETADTLPKYGLATPAISFSVSDATGKTASLLVGKKEGDEYFARDTARPIIFRINQDLYKKLSQNFSELRDKKLAHFDPATITHAEIHNASGAILATSKNESDWALDASVQKDEGPNDKAKGSQQPKPLSLDKLFTPLQQATAEEIFDKPTPAILAKLAKPEFEAIFANKSGKTLKVEVSKESGGFVYARTSESPRIYELKPEILKDLNLKPSDLTP